MRTLHLNAYVCAAIIFFSSVAIASENTTQTGIPLDAPWKIEVYKFAKKNVVHSIWGIAHSERNFQISKQIGDKEGVKFNKDVLFAAAFLHDIGAIEPFRIKGIEHATRSIQVAEPLLQSYGLNQIFIEQVKEAILGHMYDAELKAKSIEAQLFHDADTLDFLGNIGVVRIVGLTDHHAWAPNLYGAIDTLQGWTHVLPGTLFTLHGKEMAELRIKEMNAFLSTLNPYTFSGKAL